MTISSDGHTCQLSAGLENEKKADLLHLFPVCAPSCREKSPFQDEGGDSRTERPETDTEGSDQGM